MDSMLDEEAQVLSRKYLDLYFDTEDIIGTRIIFIGIAVLIVMMLSSYYYIYIKKVALEVSSYILKRKTSILQASIFILVLLIIYLGVTSSLERSIFISRNITMLSWYVGIPVFIIGLVGLLYIFYKKFFSWEYFFPLLVAFAFFFYFSIDLRNRNVQPWAMRRFIITIPFLYFAFTDLLFRLAKKGFKKTTLMIFVSGLILSVVIVLPITPFVEYKPIYSQIEDYNNKFDENDVLIYLNWADNRFAFPLKFFQDKNVYALSRAYHPQSKILDDENLQNDLSDTIDHLLSNNKHVFIVNPEQRMINFFNEKFSVSKHHDQGLKFQNIKVEKNAPATQFVESRATLHVYRVERGSG